MAFKRTIAYDILLIILVKIFLIGGLLLWSKTQIRPTIKAYGILFNPS